MSYNLKSVRDVNIQGKTVLLRADLDVPIQSSIINHQSSIIDDTRLKAWFPTLQYLLEERATVIIVGHLGRPAGKHSKFSLLPIAKWLAVKFKTQNLKLKTAQLGEFSGWEITDRIFLLENIRFYKEEEENDSQ